MGRDREPDYRTYETRRDRATVCLGFGILSALASAAMYWLSWSAGSPIGWFWLYVGPVTLFIALLLIPLGFKLAVKADAIRPSGAKPISPQGWGWFVFWTLFILPILVSFGFSNQKPLVEVTLLLPDGYQGVVLLSRTDSPAGETPEKIEVRVPASGIVKEPALYWVLEGGRSFTITSARYADGKPIAPRMGAGRAAPHRRSSRS